MSTLPTISRSVFTAAITAGISRCEGAGLLGPAEKKRLMFVAAHASAFDTNFGDQEGVLNYGCPAAQAALPASHDSTLSPRWQFAGAFDGALPGTLYSGPHPLIGGRRRVFASRVEVAG